MGTERFDAEIHQWTTHETVEKNIEEALHWLGKCEAEQTLTYVHDAVSHLVTVPEDIRYLASDLATAKAERDAWEHAFESYFKDVERSPCLCGGRTDGSACPSCEIHGVPNARVAPVYRELLKTKADAGCLIGEQVTRAESAEASLQTARERIEELEEWAERMPRRWSGEGHNDPEFQWWLERPTSARRGEKP